MRRAPKCRAVLAAVALAGVGFAPPSAWGAEADPTWKPIPKAECQPGDTVETGLQGQVPREDRASGRAARGYACNLRLLGRYPGNSFASFDTYESCGYYSDNPGAIGTMADTGTIVLDLTDPARPVKTDYLTARGSDRADLTYPVVAPAVGFQYDDHYCTPDRLRDPTILACAQIMSGLRVYDIRNPRRPREIAYYNPGTVSPTDETVDWALARPVIRRDLGQIWFVTTFGGFHAVEFENGLWPFPDSDPCPAPWDHHQAQYDPGYEDCLGRPAEATRFMEPERTRPHRRDRPERKPGKADTPLRM